MTHCEDILAHFVGIIFNPIKAPVYAVVAGATAGFVVRFAIGTAITFSFPISADKHLPCTAVRLHSPREVKFRVIELRSRLASEKILAPILRVNCSSIHTRQVTDRIRNPRHPCSIAIVSRLYEHGIPPRIDPTDRPRPNSLRSNIKGRIKPCRSCHNIF